MFEAEKTRGFAIFCQLSSPVHRLLRAGSRSDTGLVNFILFD